MKSDSISQNLNYAEIHIHVSPQNRLAKQVQGLFIF